MKRISILLVLVLITVLLASCAGEAQEANQGETDGPTGTGDASENASDSNDPIIIRFSYVTAPDSEKGLAAERFKTLAEERTDGRVRVELYPSGQLFDDDESLEALPRDTVQLIAISITKLVSFDPAFQIVDLPFLFLDDEAVYRFWDGEGGAILSESLSEYNIKYLGFWANGFKNFATINRPIKSPEDLTGLNFRTQAGSVLEAQFDTLGAASTTMPFTEVYPALQQGVIDGIENTFVDIETMNFDEVTNYLTVSEHGRIDYAFLTNATFWDGLPDDIRQTLDEIVAEVTLQEREIAAGLIDSAYETLKERGNVEIYELTLEEKEVFRNALQPVYDQFSDVIGAELLELAERANE